MDSEVNYKRVGLFITLSMVITTFIFASLMGFLGDSNKKNYLVYFEKQSLDGLQKDSPVTMKGIKIGTVENYAISEDNIQRVKVSILIDTDAPIKVDSRAVLKRNMLTGIARIDIVGGTQGSTSLEKTYKDEIPIIREELTDLEKIADSLPQFLSQIDQTVNRINMVLSDENIKNFSESMLSLSILSNDLKETSPKIKESIELINQTTKATSSFSKKYLSEKDKNIGDDIKEILGNLNIASENLKLSSEYLEPTIKGTERSLYSIEDSLKNISQDFKSFSETYSNPNLLLQKNNEH